MDYFEYMEKASKLVINELGNGIYYLEPAWRIILDGEGLQPYKVKNVKLSWEMTKEWLELQIKKLNAANDKLPEVTSWLHQVITAQIEPAVLEEETEFVKNITEYMKAKQEGS